MKCGEKYRIGDFYCGFYPYLNSEQKKLNNEILEVIKSYGGNIADHYSNMKKKTL